MASMNSKCRIFNFYNILIFQFLGDMNQTDYEKWRKSTALAMAPSLMVASWVTHNRTCTIQAKDFTIKPNKIKKIQSKFKEKLQILICHLYNYPIKNLHLFLENHSSSVIILQCWNKRTQQHKNLNWIQILKLKRKYLGNKMELLTLTTMIKTKGTNPNKMERARQHQTLSWMISGGIFQSRMKRANKL